MLLLYDCPDLVGCDAVLLETELLPDVDPVLGLRYAGGAERVTVVPPAGLTALPLEVLPEVLFTFVAVVLFVVVLLTEELYLFQDKHMHNQIHYCRDRQSGFSPGEDRCRQQAQSRI